MHFGQSATNHASFGQPQILFVREGYLDSPFTSFTSDDKHDQVVGWISVHKQRTIDSLLSAYPSGPAPFGQLLTPNQAFYSAYVRGQLLSLSEGMHMCGMGAFSATQQSDQAAFGKLPSTPTRFC